MKLKRGQKICKKCNAICAARSRICKECGAAFISKNTPIKNEVKDWRALETGQEIRVIQGTGPYYICSSQSEEYEEGDKIYMGCKGKYQVTGIRPEGLLGKGVGKNNRGIDFIYMGDRKVSESTGVVQVAHRIVKLRTRKRK